MMKRMSVLAVTLLVVIAATAAGAIGVVVANVNDDTRRMGGGMMGPRSAAAPGWGHGYGDSMTGTVGTVSEPDYLAEMVAHHEDAVAAARELARSARPSMRRLGRSIVETQSAQIQQMRTWLAEWYRDVTPTVDYQPMMRDLSGLSGDRLDRVFLQDMIGHHMVAVMMSRHLLWNGTRHDEVADLARSIVDEQQSEIMLMRSWLVQWFDIDQWVGMGHGAWCGHAMGLRAHGTSSR